MPSTGKRTNSSGEETRSRIVAATLATLKSEGIVGTSARNIAKAGDFNQALVFYHFGSVDDLVIAAVSSMSCDRIDRYRPRLESVSSLTEMVGVARELHAEDVANDNMKVFTQAFAGAVGNSEIGPKLYAELQPWTDLVTETVDRVLADVPAAAAIERASLDPALVVVGRSAAPRPLVPGLSVVRRLVDRLGCPLAIVPVVARADPTVQRRVPHE